MKKALGKGLSALIPDSYINKNEPESDPDAAEIQAIEQAARLSEKQELPPSNSRQNVSGLMLIPLARVITNIDQPRRTFTPEGIEELAASIKEKGILQPIIVKRLSNDQYMIICGERRFRAAKLCGLEEIPAIVKDVAGEDLLEWALIENIQREDLNPIEEASAYQRLLEERMIPHEELAKRVGKDRSTISNSLRLLRLPEEIQGFLVMGQITNGHARALLGLLTPEHQRQMAKKIVEENLSVRQVEAISRRSSAQKRRAKSARHLAPEIVDLENRLEQILGTQVKIYPRKNQKEGRLEVHYYSLDDLDRILQKIGLPRG